MFACDVTGKIQHEAPGDGTKYEDESSSVWLPERRAVMVPDAVYGSMLKRVELWLEREGVG